MSSADSVRRRSTAVPTVPYPSRATFVSTDRCLLLLDVQRAEASTHLLDLLRGELAPPLLEHRLTAIHLGHPLAGERAVLDAGEHRAHVLAHVLVYHLRPDLVRAVLGGVRDRVVHALDTALPDQVDD